MIHEHSMIEEWDEEMVKLVEKKEDNDTLKLPEQTLQDNCIKETIVNDLC
jgi:hypothetical protein